MVCACVLTNATFFYTLFKDLRRGHLNSSATQITAYSDTRLTHTDGDGLELHMSDSRSDSHAAVEGPFDPRDSKNIGITTSHHSEGWRLV